MLRNFLFSTVFFSGIILISIIFLPSLLFPQSIVLIGGKLMGHWTSFCLKKILFVTIEVKGKENIVKKNKFFYKIPNKYLYPFIIAFVLVSLIFFRVINNKDTNGSYIPAKLDGNTIIPGKVEYDE